MGKLDNLQYVSQRAGNAFNPAVAEQEQNDDDTDSLTSNNTQNETHARLGRRGDPRMHKAVAARLAQPNLSLIEALRIGGFDYPEDANDDHYVLENDTVSLGQRKNQLSRRCRLAKLQANGTPTTKTKQRRPSTAQQTDNAEQIMSMNRSQEPRTRGQKRAVELSEDDAMGEGEDAQLDGRQRMAKFHPQYHPIIVPPAHVPIGVIANQASQESTLASRSAASTAGWPAPGSFATQKERSQSLVESLNNHSKPLPSGVAVASLNATAASVGLTLEQLAVSLSSTTNLAKVLADQSNPDIKQQLALNLFRAECGTLYQRCMLLAGYDVEDTRTTSLAYKEFAYKAWSAEGKRLELQVGRMDGASSPNVHLQSQDTVSDKIHPAMNLNRSHSHDHNESNEGCCGPDGRHVHRLDGKCGHQAIIHQPKGAAPHVDFVVNGRVECYEGITPPGPCIMWPSRYNCDQLDCPAESNPDAHKVRRSIKCCYRK